jgi:hypothetical protein
MIYLSKLAKRLALAARHSALPAAAFMSLVAGCTPSEEREFLSPNNPQTSVVVTLTVEPKVGTVRPGEVIQFKATPKNVMGGNVAAQVDWSASGGSIDGEGRFVADQLGQFQVVATLRGNTTITDSARVSVFLHASDVITLDVTPVIEEISVGEGVQLEAVAQLADGRVVRQPPLAWTVPAGEVDGDGYFTAPDAAGTYTVNARAASGVSAKADVNVKAGKRAVQHITITPSTATVPVGQARQFVAEGSYDDGTVKPVSVVWSSNGGTINADGYFKAGGTPGTFFVAARYKQGNQVDTATVTVTPAEIVDLEIEPDGSSLATGAHQQFSATARLSDGTLREVGAAWQATGGVINSAGLYTAGSIAGTFRVVAVVAGSSFADTVPVTITAPAVTLTSVILTPSNVSMAVGTGRQFQVSGTWSDGSTQVPAVTWSATGGTITSGGYYQAGNGTGTYRVIATSTTWGKADTSVVVLGAATLTSIALLPATASLYPNETRQFSVSGTWSDGSTSVPPVSWVADGGTISPSGLYAAGSTPGTFPVIATHASGTADTSLVTIAPPPPTLLTLTLAPGTATVAPGSSIQFAVSGTWTADGSGPPPVTYSATGGTISTSGLYTAGMTTGSYRVIAKHTGGTLADTTAVTIAASAPTLTSLTVSPGSASVQTGASKQFSVSGVWSDGSTTTPAVTWSTNGGTVSSSGSYVAPASAGTYRVVAKQVGGTKADTADVTVTQATTIVSLAVSPGTKNLATGQSQQFSALATYSNGGTGTPAVTWSASAGAVSTSGLYTAPANPGQFRVIAQASGGTVRDTAEVQVAAPTVTALQLTPASVTLQPAVTQQFTAAASWSDGATRAVTPTYTATGGTISSGGLYTAGTQAGTFRVIVSCSGCTVSDTAAITIQSPTAGATITSVTVAPGTITLDIGEVYQFTATARRSDGTIDNSATLTWSSTSGDITGSGWYRAPRTAGSYTVTARHSGGVSGTATVTVRVPTAPYFTDNFDSCGLDKTVNAQGFYWKDTGGGTTQEKPVVVNGVAKSGSCSLKFTFAAGAAGDDAWSEQRFVFGKKLSEVYLQWYQYWPTGSESPTRGPKFVHRDDTGPDNNKFLRLWDEEYSNYRVKLGFSTMPRGGGDSNIITEYGTNLGGVGPFGSDSDGGGITDSRRGRWVRITVHVRLATAANNDGVIEMWVDGVKTISNTSLPLYPDNGLGNYLRNGYLMGWANSGFSSTSSTWIDDLVISGVPIP